ncbi:hypothetical protein [Nonomuraea dietziae]|uniref:hypothetical protein n=1 Tax=Nonomuraea dietziae TaxID=65515 RepID=UPI0031DBAA8C
MTAQKEHFRWLFAAVAGSAAIAWLATSTGVNGATPRTEPKKSAALGVFLASDARGTKRLPYFEEWLGAEVTVGRTYLPGEKLVGLSGTRLHSRTVDHLARRQTGADPGAERPHDRAERVRDA